MRNLTKLAVILLIIAMAFSCSSTNGSKSTTTTKSQTGEWPSGTIHFEEWQVMAMLSGDWGHGTLGFNGKTYKFKVTGLGAGGYGVQKFSATGELDTDVGQGTLRHVPILRSHGRGHRQVVRTA